ncbi:MAG: hypothetical protein ACQEVA_08055 [Myxococcota bacterium]
MRFDARVIQPLLLALVLSLAAILSSACSDDGGENGDVGLSDTAGEDASEDATGDASTDADSGPLEIGETCTRPGTCVDGAACVGDERGDDFQCMKICSEAGRVCEDGSFCTARLNAPPVCYTLGDVAEGEACSVNLECESGSLCFGAEPEQYCIRGCHVLDDVCAEGEFCDTKDQRGPCRSIIGADCDANDDCQDGLTCTSTLAEPLGSTFPKGYCTETGCTSDDDCPYTSVCRTPPGTETAICMQPCEFESDCRFNHDYTCLGPTGCADTNDRDACGAFVGNQKLCVPDAFKAQF